MSEEQVRELAIRAGAPLAAAPVDKAAGDTLRLVAAGRKPDPVLRRLLLDALLGLDREERSPDAAAGVSDTARAASAWVGASATERGKALHDLLLLADALPVPRRPQAIQFPRLRSTRS